MLQDIQLGEGGNICRDSWEEEQEIPAHRDGIGKTRAHPGQGAGNHGCGVTEVMEERGR